MRTRTTEYRSAWTPKKEVPVNRVTLPDPEWKTDLPEPMRDPLFMPQPDNQEQRQ